MKKKILVLMLASMLTASCVACGSKSSDKKDKLSSAATEMLSETETETEQIEEQDITADDLKPLADAGVITGVKDITVAEGTDVKLNDLVCVDSTIVKNVDIDDSAVDYSKAGTYEVIYTITFDDEKLRDYVKDNNLNVNFDTNGDTIVVKTTVTVTVATKENTDAAIAAGNTDVVTTETKESVAESNKAKANDNAVASQPAETPAGNTDNSNGNTGNSNSGNTNANTGNSNSGNSGTSSENKPSQPAESKPSGGNNSSTETPHVHQYDSGVVTKAPTCTDTGIKTYTCVNGDHSYTETIPALGHVPVQRTETVTVKEAWTEDVYEPRYICNGCGAQFENDKDAIRHIIVNPSGNCNNYYSDSVKVNTITHPAETETHTYKVCSRCGERLN